MTYFRQLAPLLTGLAMVLTLSACSIPGTMLRQSPANAEIVGVKSTLGPGLQADVLLVHGMCVHDENWVTTTNDRLAKALDMTVDKDTKSVLRIGRYGGMLYTRNLSNKDGARVRTFALLWSPVVDKARGALCYDTTEPTKACTSDDGHLADPRAIANALLKNELLDGCLSDAIYAIGEDGIATVGSTVEEGLAVALSGGTQELAGEAMDLASFRSQSAPLFVVTESLGSKLFVDAAIRMANRSCQARDNMAFAIGRTTQVFMAANQLPILSLAYNPSLHRKCGEAMAQLAAPPPPKGLRALAELYRSERTLLNAPELPLRVVAFSDPNDLLSYTLAPLAMRFPDLAVADVVVANDWAWLGLFENPLVAHTSYLTKCRVNNVIAAGTSGLTQACPLFK